MKIKLFSFNMGKKKAINNLKKTFRLQFLFHTLIFSIFRFATFYGEKFKRGKNEKSKHLGFQA